MNENLEKIVWILGDLLLMILTLEHSSFWITILIPYCLYQGAYFRGKNWLTGWREIKLTGKRVGEFKNPNKMRQKTKDSTRGNKE